MLEARTLDVTPILFEKIQKEEDTVSSDILAAIMRDEVGHVAMGKNWFD